MKVFLIMFFFGLGLVACGSTEEDAAKELNANTITLDPPAGSYAFKTWVKMSKKEKGLGSGVVKVKAPGKTEFEDASCVYSPYEVGFEYDCVEITQTGDLEYYLFNTAAESDKSMASYVIDLVQHDLTIESREEKDAATADETITLTEKETFCKYDSDFGFHVSIQTTSSQIGPDKYAYLGFDVGSEAKAGDTIKITEINEDKIAGMIIKARSDDVPHNHYSTIDDYTTSQSTDWDTDEKPAAECTIEITTVTKAGITNGEINCVGLRNYDDDIGDAKKPFGKHINISGKWQCDGYQ